MKDIQNIDQLIEEAMKIQSKDERLKFVMNYFLETVDYNYAQLFISGYMREGIESIDFGYRLVPPKFNNYGITDAVLDRRIVKGNSKIFNDLVKIEEECTENYEKFISSIREYIKQELAKHIQNENIVTENANDLAEKIGNDLINKKIDVMLYEEDYSLNLDTSGLLMEYLLNVSNNFPMEVENGLLKKGVCANYTDYLLPLLKKLGIEAHRIGGTSIFGHAWVVVNTDEGYKSVDLTRAINKRDGLLGIPLEQTCEDWIFSDIGKAFEMQSTRTITEIDGQKLEKAITPENYDEEEFNQILENIKAKQNTKTKKEVLENIVNQGLEKDEITLAESKNAEEQEIEKGEDERNEQ